MQNDVCATSDKNTNFNIQKSFSMQGRDFEFFMQ